MKLFINKRPEDQNLAWGGGNAFLSRFVEYAERLYGQPVVYGLSDDIDLIFIIDPRDPRLPLIYSHKEEYGIPIVQRVGDVGTHGKPYMIELLSNSLRRCDLAIYPSEWARDYLSFRQIQARSEVVIPNAADNVYFHKKLSVVTHHWSDNPMKGEDIYRKLDEDVPALGIDFTFIGRTRIQFKNTKYIAPMTKHELSIELCCHNIYLTASRFEAGANHVMEALASGLFVLYRESGGSIPEYCKCRGIQYNDYEDLKRILSPLQTMNFMCEKYVAALESVC